MKKQNENLTDAALLRQKAEEQMKLRKDKACPVSTPAAEPDLLKLIHELEVHQIELELQNEELIIAKEKAELAEEKYTELYDFAPSGYVALSKKGEILELNFAAANMLGKERTKLVKERFDFFVSIDTQATFNQFLLDVFTIKVKLSCEVIIATEGNLPINVNIDGILSQNNEYCLLTVVDITERKQVEEKIIESENNFRGIFESHSAAVAIIETDTTISMVNDSYCKISGYTREEVLGLSWIKQIPPDDLERLKEYNRIRMLNPADAPSDYEFTFYHKNGEIKHAMMSVGIISGTKKIIASFIDISQRKQAEQELIKAKEKAVENEVKLKEAQRIAHLGNWVLNIETNEFSWSDEIYRIFDCEPHEFDATYEAFIGFIHSDDREKVNSAYLKSLETKTEYQIEHRIITKNNQLKYVQEKYTTTFNEQGKPLSSIGIVIDITAQKALENELIKAKEHAEESEARFRNLMEDIDTVAVQGYGPEGITRFWNKASEKLYGFTQQEAIGRNLLDLIIPVEMKDGVTNAMHVMAETGKPIPSGELLLKRKDGSLVPVISHHAIVRVPGHAQELFCLDVDITARKQAETELQKRVDELELFHSLVVGRELKMIELKKEINELSKKLGEDKDRY